MSASYTEKRHHIRLPINHVMSYRIDASDESGYGTCKNLSADGMLFSTGQRMTPGTLVDINITPKKSAVIPLEVSVEVTRVIQSDNNEFNIAGIIREMN